MTGAPGTDQLGQGDAGQDFSILQGQNPVQCHRAGTSGHDQGGHDTGLVVFGQLDEGAHHFIGKL